MDELFHQRFNLAIDFDQARQRFVNRVDNEIFGTYFCSNLSSTYAALLRTTATAFGEVYKGGLFRDYVEYDFYKCLQALEACYGLLEIHADYPKNSIDHLRLGRTITNLISISECDLGVIWDNGKFRKTGAAILDDVLVNENLRWLRQNGLENVLKPFEKALDHFLHADKRPELLSDVVTDAYEALEALAKVLTGRDQDLSTNHELFIKKVRASEAYKLILKDYMKYANKFRHAAKDESTRPILAKNEVESFLYLTGIFLRLGTNME